MWQIQWMQLLKCKPTLAMRQHIYYLYAEYQLAITTFLQAAFE